MTSKIYTVCALFMLPVVGICGAADTTATPEKTHLTIGGYGEAVMQRMFYSDNAARYYYPETYANADGHGRADLPHVVLYAAYDFGRGWKMSAELEYEHGGSGSTYEIENSEAGEYETEIEKGGEVAIEQFWLEKSFSRAANLRMGHIIVPVGLTNLQHFPTEFFSVLRPEEESSILPCTWHQTGISFWGRADALRYEALFVSGLDAERFGNSTWVADGATSPYEFEIANSYAGALRLDYYALKGLRVGASGYYGFSAANSLKAERYASRSVKGIVSIGALDAEYNDHHLLARANVVYGHLGGSYDISMVNKRLPSASPSPRTEVASDALSAYVEAGYDVLSLFGQHQQRLYLFGHYGYYDSMFDTAEGIVFSTVGGSEVRTIEKIADKAWCARTVISAGVNYFPLKEVVIKAEYGFRKFVAPYNNEPTVSIGIGYAGIFK
jgi:hypothetical protein